MCPPKPDAEGSGLYDPPPYNSEGDFDYPSDHLTGIITGSHAEQQATWDRWLVDPAKQSPAEKAIHQSIPAKLKKKLGFGRQPKPAIVISEDAIAASEEIMETFWALLHHAAQISGLRRKTDLIGRVDYDEGFKAIANPQPRPKWIGTSIESATLLCGIVISAGVNIITSDNQDNAWIGWTLSISGALIGISLIAIDHNKS